MGWIKDPAYNHEGWVANVLADGRVSGSMTGTGVIVHELTDEDVAAGYEVRRYAGGDHLDVVIPWDQVTLWRAMCECGWTGVERPALGDAGGSRDCPEEIEEKVFYPDWVAHVAPYTALGELEQLVEQQRELDTRVQDAVRLARSSGASWSQLGRAAGLSKQGAQQRWGHLVS